MASRVVHVVMGSGIIFGVYRRADLAIQHARCITGTSVATVDLEMVPPDLCLIIDTEILDELPPEIRLDIQTAEWENEDDVTPIESAVNSIDVPLDEIDDKD